MVLRLITCEGVMACCGYVMPWEDAKPLLDSARDKRRAHADTAPQPLPAYITGDYAGEIERNEARRAAVLAAKLPDIDVVGLDSWIPLSEPLVEQRVADTEPSLAKSLASVQSIYDQYYPPAERLSVRYEAAPEHGPDAMQVRVTAHPECPADSIYFVGSGGMVNKLTLKDAPTPQTATKPVTSPPTDPLDVEYDGWTLRKLLWWDEGARRTENRAGGPAAFTPLQRSAISAHWSAQLRAKVAAAKLKEREQVVCERDEDGQ